MSGQSDQVTGKGKEIAGKLTGDDEMEAEGKGQHATGKAKEALDDAAKTAKGVLGSLKDKLSGHDK